MLPKDSSIISTVIDNQAQWVKGGNQWHTIKELISLVTFKGN